MGVKCWPAVRLLALPWRGDEIMCSSHGLKYEVRRHLDNIPEGAPLTRCHVECPDH